MEEKEKAQEEQTGMTHTGKDGMEDNMPSHGCMETTWRRRDGEKEPKRNKETPLTEKAKEKETKEEAKDKRHATTATR